MKHYQHYLKNEQATQDFGKLLAALCHPPLFIALAGDLGTGKTTLVRALLRELGVASAIKSPTYSLIEVYEINKHKFIHVDLYRLTDPEELELIGWRDYLAESAVWLVEWPEKAGSLIAAPDLYCSLTIENQGRVIEISAHSEKGDKILEQIRQLM